MEPPVHERNDTRLGASREEVQDQSLKFSFPEGRIEDAEVTQLDPTPNMRPWSRRSWTDGT